MAVLCCRVDVSVWDLLAAGQSPYKWSSSKLDVVAHQSKPSALPAAVHSPYHLPLNRKGKAHGAPLEFPNSVNRSEVAKGKF